MTENRIPSLPPYPPELQALSQRADLLLSDWCSLDKQNLKVKARAKRRLGIQMAALHLLIEHGTPWKLVALFSEMLDQAARKDYVETQHFIAKLAAAEFEADHFAAIYKTQGLDPNKEQKIKPASVSEVARVMAKAQDNPGGDYRHPVRRLRNQNSYQALIQELLIEKVRPLGTN